MPGTISIEAMMKIMAADPGKKLPASLKNDLCFLSTEDPKALALVRHSLPGEEAEKAESGGAPQGPMASLKPVRCSAKPETPIYREGVQGALATGR